MATLIISAAYQTSFFQLFASSRRQDQKALKVQG
jgi:hypothetical protein